MGISNLHSALPDMGKSRIPNEPERECAAQMDYHTRHQRFLSDFGDYVELELKSGERLGVVAANISLLSRRIWAFGLSKYSRQHNHTRLSRSTSSNDQATKPILRAFWRQLTSRYRQALCSFHFRTSMRFFISTSSCRR
jgi:hypothetical protein